MKHTKLPLTYEDAKQRLVEMLPDEPDVPELVWFLDLNPTKQAIHRVLRQADQHERLVEALKLARSLVREPGVTSPFPYIEKVRKIDAALDACEVG